MITFLSVMTGLILAACVALFVYEVIALAMNDWSVPDKSLIARYVYDKHHGKLGWCVMFWKMVLSTILLAIISILLMIFATQYVVGAFELITWDFFLPDGKVTGSFLLFIMPTIILAASAAMFFLEEKYTDYQRAKRIKNILEDKPVKEPNKLMKGLAALRQAWNDKFCPVIKG